MTQHPQRYERDMRGYGRRKPAVKWPNGAKIAVQFVLNYEEGGENCLLHGDKASEAFLSEIVGAQQWQGQRHWNMESIYEYGARAGFWRVHELFTQFDLPLTIYGVATALKRSPEQVAAMQEAGWEIASHGLKWIEYKDFTEAEERDHMKQAIQLHYEATGEYPKGWYTGRCSDHTVALTQEMGCFDYVSDSYADDLPYWRAPMGDAQAPQLIIPYTLDTNDMRFAAVQGFNSGDQFFTYLKDSFDALYAEGEAGAPKMLNIGLHCRLIGRPGRIMALRRFLDYIQSKPDVWVARRIDIARHWMEHHPYAALIFDVVKMSRKAFVDQFGGVFEHSPWIAERAFEAEMGPAHNCATGVHAALAAQFRKARESERLKVLNAHPDLAGKLAAAKRLTADSTKEQASAGLNALTDEERTTFTALNEAYTAKFGFPFIIAVKGLNKDQILEQFQQRVHHERDQEFTTACQQVERIALLRLKDMFEEE